MDAIARTVWVIESNSLRDISLDEIAETVGVSRFHLTRAFGQSLGRSVMSYLRARRLTEAAKRLADGAPDILTVALEAGYGSHEAFTRAFRSEFGVTPEQFRSAPAKADVKFTESFLMNAEAKIDLDEPRMHDAQPMLFAGIGRRFEYDDMGAVPQQWQRLNEYAGTVPSAVPGGAYGICTNADANGLDYISAFEVRDFDDLPPEFTRLRVPAQRYAIYGHSGHISEIRSVVRTIFGELVPKSGHELADAPSLEYYGSGFDPATGKGGYEIWVPIRS